MNIMITGWIAIFENRKLVDKVSKEIDRFNKRILKLGNIDGGISVSNSKEVISWLKEGD